MTKASHGLQRRAIQADLAPGSIETIAGTTEGAHWGDGGLATRAQLNGPYGVGLDVSGNLYVADSRGHRVRRIGASGTITTFAGTGERGWAGDGGPAGEALLASPSGIAVDAAGNVYIADTGNRRVRRIDPSGTITTFAGTGERGWAGDGGPAGEALLASPSGIAVDAAGNVYIADTGNRRVRRIDPSGTITTFAGTGEPGTEGDGGPATAAQFVAPRDVVADAFGNVYVVDTGNHRLRRIDTSGTITAFAGTGERGYGGDGGAATAALLNEPQGVAADAAGNVYVADASNHRMRRIDASGTITTVAGGGEPGAGGDGGPATMAQLFDPRGVAVGTAGNLYIADYRNRRVRRIDASGTVSTFAGTAERGYGGDGGPATESVLTGPAGATVDAAGNVYIADAWDNRVRRIDPSGRITTVAGTGEPGYGGDGGPAAEASLYAPWGVALDSAGSVYVAEVGNDRVRRIDPSGRITTVAGTGDPGYGGDGGPATDASLNAPGGVAVDAGGNLYVGDASNHRVRRIDPSGTITTVAGTGEPGYGGDGGPAAAAELYSPDGVAVDAAGNLYIADTGNHRVRRVDPGGTITTVAGTGLRGFWGDGRPATEADFTAPYGVTADAGGNLYIADSFNHRVRRVHPSGLIETVAGTGERGYGGDGGPATEALLDAPPAVAVDAAGNVYLADYFNFRVRVVAAPSAEPPVLEAFQPRSIAVHLGGSGETVKLVTTADGGWTLNGEALASGDTVTAPNGDTYRLSYSEGVWAATLVATGIEPGDFRVRVVATPSAEPPVLEAFQPRSIAVHLGGSGETVKLVTTADGGWTLNGEALASGDTVTAPNGGTYRLSYSEGVWAATLVATGIEPGGAVFRAHHVILRVVRVTPDWIPYADTSGWTQAVPTKESEHVKYFEAAIWEETASVHLYEFDNDYDASYGRTGGRTDEESIAYREQFAKKTYGEMPPKYTAERSEFLRIAFQDFASYLVERYPDSDHHIMYSGHGGPGGRLFAGHLRYQDAHEMLGFWRQTLSRPLGVIDMGGPCNKGSFSDLENFCDHARFFVASDLPNGGYTFDDWTGEKYVETDPDSQYPRLFAESGSLEEVLRARIDLKQKAYEYSRTNMISGLVEQANYLYSCSKFEPFSVAFRSFLETTGVDYSISDDLYQYMLDNQADAALFEQFSNVIIHQADNKDFFEWEVVANGMTMPLPLD